MPRKSSGSGRVAVKRVRQRRRKENITASRGGRPGPSRTTKSNSNTNLVGAGKKGGYGTRGVVVPKKGPKKPGKRGGGPKRAMPSKPGVSTKGPRKPRNPRKPKRPMTGNPGNAKNKGRAGEKVEKGMWPGGGVRGKGDNRTTRNTGPKKKKKK